MSKQKHNFCEFCQKYLNYIQNYPSQNKIRESWKFEPPYCAYMAEGNIYFYVQMYRSGYIIGPTMP